MMKVMNEAQKTKMIGIINSLYLILFKTIAFSEGAIEAHNEKKNRNGDEEKIPIP